MTQSRYQVVWTPQMGSHYPVGITLDREMVELALAGNLFDTKTVAYRLELCWKVRIAASADNPRLLMEPILFISLTFAQLS